MGQIITVELKFEEMSKEECISKLIEQGFNACLDNGVVMVTVASEVERNRAEKAIKELGLRGSWGSREVIK